MSQLSDIGNIKSILSRHGFSFSRSLGQNFLVNPGVCPRMAEECGAREGVCALEIGPGIGVLTYELARRADKVAAIELDRRLLPVLEETLGEFSNVTVSSGDVMKLDLRQVIQEQFGDKPVCLCANLPYYITSPVIMKVLEEKLPVDSLTVMVQKEAAQRICAEPGSRNVGAVSIAVRYYAQPEMLFQVSRGSFLPPPNVDSAVIRMKIRETPAVSVEDEAFFFQTVKAAFAQRRKTLANSLSAGLAVSKQQALETLAACEIPPNARAEELTMERFGRLSDALFRKVNCIERG